ncbi:SRPBCC family protein [Leptothrix discophora]|uniref:SRPBCC family protein n=1 Tax=Leptothrix discophora TaxID=89 RepID=A0ABT9G6J5_LEPDI|nr:SRPBCC family protein [Leptothrix discophora]MDP4302116.1 SRPBCC family protein [Leptothrix discophora]
MKLILLVVIAVVAVLLWRASRRPDRFRIERSAVIAAPAATLHALVDDFHRWVDWSPWEDRDPALRREYGGAPHGTGARYAWSGNRQVGRGEMTITRSVPARSIELKLDFLAPFEAHNVGAFTFEPVAGGTRVVWVMEGPASFANKLMGLLLDIDRMVGRDFERGLQRLEALALRTPA